MRTREIAYRSRKRAREAPDVESRASRARAYLLREIADRLGAEAPTLRRPDGRPYRFTPNDAGRGRCSDPVPPFEGAMIECYWDNGPWRRDVGIAADRERFYAVMRALDLDPPPVPKPVYSDDGRQLNWRAIDASVHRLQDWVSGRRRAWSELVLAIERAAHRDDARRAWLARDD